MELFSSMAFVKGFIANSKLTLTVEFRFPSTIVVLDFKVIVDYFNFVVQLLFVVVKLKQVNFLLLISFIIASPNVFASILLYEQIFFLVNLIPF